MEHIITSHIMKHADTHNILYPLQHETQLIECVDDITRNIDAFHYMAGNDVFHQLACNTCERDWSVVDGT
jgi:NAD-dependent SIR2 family protein deacetylase